ncbi:hypothetical protein F4861DRAFT_537242 [Xylaria intraflava]|nr:hypothetical protein F4861DRAFT_537242 [Xylaria intraflava]
MSGKDINELCTITITAQADIKNGKLDPCPDDGMLNIIIKNATGVLNFSNVTKASMVQVFSPELQTLQFPQLGSLRNLIADGATNLSTISFTQLSSPVPEIFPNGDYSNTDAISINITGSPALTELDLPTALGLYEVELRDVPKLNWINQNVTTAAVLESDTCLDFPALESVSDLHLTGGNSASCFRLGKLTSVANFTLTSIGPSEVSFGQMPLSLIDTLILESSVVDPSAPDPTLEFGPLATVGGSAFVTSNANGHIDLGNLNNVKGNLSISNNRNCTFNFDHLGDVDSLLLMDNPNTTLPSFPSLLRANNIHLRGYIETDDIFPALLGVSNTVTIEAWNDDFNCSKLASQQQAGTINQLSCNGTDSTYTAATSSPSSSPSDNGLSPGAKAGIGVGVTIGVLGAAIIIVWLVLRSKNQRKGLLQSSSAPPSVENRYTDVATQEEVRESSDAYAHEIDGRIPIQQVEGQMIIQENPGEEIHELPSNTYIHQTAPHTSAATSG